MSATRLDTPFLDGALRSTNYFNGRVLSREDMQRDRDAERAIHQRLGLSLGHGIVSGFEVEARVIGGSSVTDPVVTVRAGLAVNRNGDTLALDRDVDVSLLAPASTTSGSVGSGVLRRAEISDGTTRWCHNVSSSPTTIPYSSFNTMCWDTPPDGTGYAKQPINEFQFIVVGGSSSASYGVALTSVVENP